MLKLGVTELWYSPWHSQPVLVHKPDDAVQFCIDFRKLNSILQFNVYAMPHVDHFLNNLGQAVYLSILDLT